MEVSQDHNDKGVEFCRSLIGVYSAHGINIHSFNSDAIVNQILTQDLDS